MKQKLLRRLQQPQQTKGNHRVSKPPAFCRRLASFMVGALGALLVTFLVSAKPPTRVENGNEMKIIVGTNTFSATLEENPTALAFKALLPMTIKMSELNANEKYFKLSDNLPTNESNPGKIQVGDLMIYGSDTLVLFYKSFPTSYSYTRLGRIKDTTGLAGAVGSGSVTVTMELKE